MAHWRSLLPNPKYLAEFQLEGKDVTVEIAKVTAEIVTGEGGKRDTCIVLYFKDKKLPMISNKTNCKTLQRYYGKDPAGWVGKSITLYPTTEINKQKEVYDCIRMKAPPSGSTAPVQSREVTNGS